MQAGRASWPSTDLWECRRRIDHTIRLLLTATTATAAVLALPTRASAGLWLDLDRTVARPGQTVHGEAVRPCSLCGPGPLYLVDARHSGLQSLKRAPGKGDRRFVFVGRFTWKRDGRFSFRAPAVRPGVYQLHALYRNGSNWTAAPASAVLRVRAGRDDPRVSIGGFSIVVPRAWRWRTLRGPEPDSQIVQLSNASLRVRHGVDPIKGMRRGTFVLTIVQLGEHGSTTVPTITRADFLAQGDPSRPRGHALARHSFCRRKGPCFSILLELGQPTVRRRLLAEVNAALRSIRVSRRRVAIGARPG